jgi:hypothetical protein
MLRPNPVMATEIGCYAAAMFGRRKPPQEPNSTPPNAFAGLRAQALQATPELAGLSSVPDARVIYGALLDWALDEGGVATVFTLQDGTASLYLSSGGGIIGGGFHEPVRIAVRGFLLAFEPFLDTMLPDSDDAPPPSGYTDLRALTTRGRLVVRASTDDFGKRRHPMSDVFHAGQTVITALRQLEPTGRELRPNST